MPFFRRRSSSGAVSDQYGDLREKLRSDPDIKDILEKEKDHFTDQTLNRFIKARKFVFADIKTMVVNHIKWREDMDIHNINDFTFPELAQVKAIYPHGYHGVDKEGRSVYYERLGGLNVDKLLEVTTFDRMVKYWVKEYEALYKIRMPACSNAKGEDVHKTCTVLDIKGVGLSHLSSKVREFLGILSKTAGDNYPETLGAMYIVNAPFGFTTIWNLIKGMIDPETRKKIHIVNSSGTHDKLLKVIDSDQLPSFLGGLCECEGGCMMSNKGPWNDPRFSPHAKQEKEKEAKDKSSSSPLAQLKHIPEEKTQETVNVESVREEQPERFVDAPKIAAHVLVEPTPARLTLVDRPPLPPRLEEEPRTPQTFCSLWPFTMCSLSS